jgi:hypothetical protein
MTSKGSTSGHRVLRSVPNRTVEHCRAAHDVRHQGSIPHFTGRGNLYGQLDQLAQERQRLERRLSIWLAQKERTEAQIADLERARDQLLAALEPVLQSEAKEAERAAGIRHREAAEAKRSAPIPIHR